MKNYFQNSISKQRINLLCVFMPLIFMQFAKTGQHCIPVSVFRTDVVEPEEILTDLTGTSHIDQIILVGNVRHDLTGISEGIAGFRFMLVNVLTFQLGGQLEQRTEHRTATLINFPMNIKGGLT